jgi:hypothetical protein
MAEKNGKHSLGYFMITAQVPEFGNLFHGYLKQKDLRKLV